MPGLTHYNMASAAKKACFSKLSGAVFGVLQNGKAVMKRHPLDTNKTKYYMNIKNVVIPQCVHVAREIPLIPERIETLLTYCFPPFPDTWNFPVELMYRTVAEKAYQNEENLTKIHLLRAAMDMVLAMSVVMDDIADKMDYRQGEKTWRTICSGGDAVAIYDGPLFHFFAFDLLEKNFRDNPSCMKMMDLLGVSGTKLMIAQTADSVLQNSIPSRGDYNTICKAFADHLGIGPALGLLLAGESSPDCVEETMKLFSRMGEMIRVYDDFYRYYVAYEQPGLPALELKTSGASWASITAMDHFNAEQSNDFKECFGSQEQAKVKRVHELYREIDLPQLYVEHMAQGYRTCKQAIEKHSHPKVREAGHSHLEWLVGSEVAQSSQ